MNMPIAAPTPVPAQPKWHLAPGLLLCGVLSLLAWPLGRAFPLVGAPVAGLLLGLLVGNVLTIGEQFQSGIQVSVQKLLKWAIMGLGLQLPLQQLWTVGRDSLKVTLVTLSLAFVVALVLGKWMKVPHKLAILVGAGTAICGGSAIAAVAPVISPSKQELALSLTTIFLFNLLAVFLFPFFGHVLGLDQAAFGLWAGTAINDTSSVVAAAYSYGHEAGDIATIVKLTRATMILPVTLILSAIMARQTGQQNGPGQPAAKASFPWFIVGFVLAAVIHTLGFLPVAWEQALIAVAEFLLIMALVAVGLSSKLRRLLHAGVRPVLLGAAVWAAVAISSLVIMRLEHVW